MRCPDCNKFVGMENADPEDNGCEVFFETGEFVVTAEVHHARNCAECGTELKAIDHQMEGRFAVELLIGGPDGKGGTIEPSETFAALSQPANKALRDAILDESADLTIEIDALESDESGGGRYAKNVTTCNVVATITAKTTLNEEDISASVEVTLSAAAAASEYEEQV